MVQNAQQNPHVLWNELLSWLFVQQKQYASAFRQEKAIYKRTGEDLSGIANLVLITIAEEDYENALQMIKEIREDKKGEYRNKFNNDREQLIKDIEQTFGIQYVP